MDKFVKKYKISREKELLRWKSNYNADEYFLMKEDKDRLKDKSIGWKSREKIKGKDKAEEFMKVKVIIWF